MLAFQNELSEERVRPSLDFDDVELSLIRMKLLQNIRYGQVPDLAEITAAALNVIQEDLMRMLDLTVDIKKSDYAVFTGMQIHGSPVISYGLRLVTL